MVRIPASALFILPNAFIADLVDHGLAISGYRLEGAYYGVQGFLNKVVIGLSSLAVGFLLSRYGYSASRPLGILLVGPVAAAFVILGAIILSRYDLD